MKIKGFQAAMLLVIVVNGAVLAGVASNRSGEPDAAVVLTERELNVSRQDKENSSVELHLNWRHFPEAELKWFDRDKLQAVGFDCRVPVDAPEAAVRYGKTVARKTYAVLEYEGPAWEAWQAEVQKKVEETAKGLAAGTATEKELAAAQKRVSWAGRSASRLFAVDAGNDPGALRQKYPDRHRYIITAARVRLDYRSPRRLGGKVVEPGKLTGKIEQILTDAIQVPHAKAGALRSLQRDASWESLEWSTGEPPTPRYLVGLRYGKRLEPWVDSVQPVK